MFTFPILMLLLGLVIGLYSGIAMGQWWEKSGRPLRLTTRHEFRPGVAVSTPAPLSHQEKCARWTVRYILFAEMLARESGKPDYQLPSRADFERAGVRWKAAWWYTGVLSGAGIVERRAGAGVYWAYDYRGRRALARRLEYPPSLPPRFDFHA